MLDLEISRIVQQAKLLERACHDSGPWAFRIGDQDLPASRVVKDRGVVFTANFPEACPISGDGRTIDLVCRGEVVNSKKMRLPVVGPFEIDWTVGLSAPVAA